MPSRRRKCRKCRKPRRFSIKQSGGNSERKCTAILTRGYDDYSKYSDLIKRNKSIQDNLIDKHIDNLIFHEGNITPEHQHNIMNETPKLKFKFINILEGNKAFKKEKESVTFSKETMGTGIGYRHMCSFWFIDFFNFVANYDYLLRIDEDCIINFNIDDVFSKLKKYIFISGQYSSDPDFVTMGLNEFTRKTMKSNKIKSPGGPYTNFIGFSLNPIRNNMIFKEYQSMIDSSNMIYERRWGDLPLWGEAIHYIFGDNTLYIDKSLKYYHGSHGAQVN